MKQRKSTIYLVRHGDVHNPKQVLYGRIPGFDLSQLGKQQAARLGKHLSAKPITAVYASPLERTRQTAAIVTSFLPSIPVVYDERLLEVRSPMEGRPLAEFTPHHFNFYSDELIALGGESMTDVWERMEQMLTDVVQ